MLFEWLGQPDAHTGSHLFGSFFLVYLVMRFRIPRKYAVVISITLGFCHELMDEFHGSFLPNFFDPRGGDWGDILVDIIGAAMALFI